MWTALTSLATTAAAVIVTRALAEAVSPDDFGAYSVTRRALALMAEVSMIPLGLAVARETAMVPDATSRQRLLWSGLAVGVSLALLIAVPGIVLRAPLAHALFHRDGYEPLVVAAACFYAGAMFYTLLYATYRGAGTMVPANAWQFVAMALGPIAAVALASSSVSDVVALMSVPYWLAALPLAAHLRGGLGRVGFTMRVGFVPSLLRYGGPRIPTGLAFGGLLATGPFLAARLGSLREAGYLAFGQSLVAIVQAGTEAFGLVVLPRVARLSSAHDRQFLRSKLTALLGFVVDIGAFLALHMLIWADQIVLLLLGSRYLEAVPLVRVMLPATVPCLAYAMFRSILDGLEVRPINTLNLLMGAGVTVTLSLGVAGMGWSGTALAAAFTAGFYVLGYRTVQQAFALTGLGLGSARLQRGLTVNLVVALVAWLTRVAVERIVSVPGLPYVAVVVAVAMLLLCILILRQAGVGWVREFESQLRPSGVVNEHRAESALS